MDNSACADPEKSAGGVGSLQVFFNSSTHFTQRAVQTSLEKQLDPRGPIASRVGSAPVFPRKPKTTCDFPGGGSGPSVPLLGPHAMIPMHNLIQVIMAACVHCYGYPGKVLMA